MIGQATASIIVATGSIIVSILTVSGSILVWALNSRTAIRREARARRDEIRKQFLERQIEEFYGPLLAITQRREAIFDIRQRLVAAFSDAEKSTRIRRFVRKQFFEDLNLEMMEILTRKLHLLEDTRMPDSFRTFLTHTMQADLQHRLWTDEQIDNRVVEGTPFPQAFSVEIAQTFSRLMSEYRSIQGRK